MKQEFYDRLAAPFETSERKKNCLLRVNHILTDVVYLVYPALLFYLMVYRDSRFWRVLLVPAVTFVLVSLFRRKFNAPRPYEKWPVKPLIPKDTKGNSFPSRHVFSIYIIAMAAWYVCLPLGVILCVAGVFLAAARVMWNPELLGDIKSEEKVRYHEDWKRKRCSDFTGTDRVIF